MSLPVRRDEQGPPHLTMRPPALPPGMPFELVHVRTAGLDVYSTHLQPMPAQAAHRVQQVLFIDDAVGRSCDPSASMPPILCGDFNAEPMSDEIRFLTAKAVIDGRSTYFQDAWAVVHDGGGITWDPANDLAAGANEPPQRIDYVFVGEAYSSPRRRRPGARRVAGVQRTPNRHVRQRPLRALRRHRLAHATIDPERSMTAVHPGTIEVSGPTGDG